MLDKQMLTELQEYVQLHLNELLFANHRLHECMESQILPDIYNDEFENFIKNHRKPTLQHVLFGFIDQKGLTDPEVYNKAGIDRRLFSKIRSIPDYTPRKNTLIALSLALELSRKETDELLGSAGYSLSDSDTHDLVVQFCLDKKIYSIHDVNHALDYFSLKPLGGSVLE